MLAAMWLEVPQSRADIVSAWQRPNAVLFIGGGREGPVRLRSLDFVPKRWARALAASLAARVIEAQYHDAVRTRTADLYTAYVDVQEAQAQARLTQASLTSVQELAKVTRRLADSGQVARADSGQVAASPRGERRGGRSP